MAEFKNFIETTMDSGYWAKRQAAYDDAAKGIKGAISGQYKRPPTTSYQNDATPHSAQSLVNPLSYQKTLLPQEVRKLGLHPNHNQVWQGSTADAPAAYPYVYVRRVNKYMSNPNYKGT